MPDLMAYWRWDVYVRDLDEGAGFHFNSRQSRLHSVIDIGERLWLVTGKPAEGGMRYLLIACLEVAAKTQNPPGYKYSPYRVWADIRRSAYFSTGGPDASPLLRQLQFATQQPITGGNIGQALQTMRSLTPSDAALLAAWAKNLPLEPRAYRIADEATLERAFDSGEDAVRETVATYHVGVSPQRRSTLVASYRRNRALVGELHMLYDGRCQLCGFDPLLLYGVRACNGHHIVYLSRSGRDELTNLMLLCPNHHEVIHATNAVFDFKDRHYVFPNHRREPLVLNKHIGVG